MDGVKSMTARDLPSDQGGGDEKDLATSFLTAAFKPREDMIVPPPPPPPPKAPPPPLPSGSDPGDILQAAQYLSAHWDKWGMHNGVSFANPPAGSPPDEVSTLAYFANNPVLDNSIVKDAGGTPGDPLSKAALDQFISNAEGDGQAVGDALWHTPSSSSSNSIIQDLSSIVANWHAWGFSSGLTPFSNPPPSDLPPDAQAALGAITSNPYLLSQIGNHTGSGAITRDDVANFLNLAAQNPVLLGQAPSTDTHVQDWLGSLGSAVSDQDKSDLGRTADDAQTVLDFFNAYPRDASELNSEVPPDVADAEKRLLDVDAIKKQITTSDGTVTRDALGSFLKSLDDAADAAKDSWGSFKKTNGSADAVATQEGVDASILQANLPVLDAAGSADAAVDGKVNLDDLKAAASNGGLPAPLAHAAAFYADQGEFSVLSRAGLDPAKTSDGLVSNDIFKTYLSAKVGGSATDTLSGLRAAALQDLSTGGDPSKVNADYYKDPSKSTATGADKLAAIVQLEQTIARYKAGESSYPQSSPSDLPSPEAYHETYGDGPTPGEQRDDFIKQVQDRIETLSGDSDVQSLLTDKMPAALQGLVSSDPALKADLQTQFDDASNTSSLEFAFRQTDDKGNHLSTTDALSSFVSNANNFAQALGITPDYSKAFADAPQDVKDKVKQGYDDIISGKEIDDLTKSGTPQDKALIQAAADKTAYDSVLDKQTVQDGTDKFGDLTAKLGRDQLTDGKSGDDLLKGLGIDGENDPKLQQLIKDNLGGLTPAGQDQASASDVLRVVRFMVDSMRSGMKFDDAVAKVRKEMGGSNSTFFTGSASDAYKSGAIHAASAILLAGGLAARISGGQSSTPATVQQSISVAGLLTEGGGKTYASIADSWKKAVDANLKALTIAKADAALPFAEPGAEERLQQAQDAYDNSKATLDKISTNLGKDIEAVGKSVGGVAGNALGFVFGITGAVQSAKAGDIGGAAAQGIFAGLNGISTVATTAEVAAYVIPRVAPLVGATLASDAPALAALAGGLAGTIGAVAGGIAAVGGLIYAIVASIQADDKRAAAEADWYKQLQDGFAPSGIPVPDLGILIGPPNGSVEDSNPPVAY